MTPPLPAPAKRLWNPIHRAKGSRQQQGQRLKGQQRQDLRAYQRQLATYRVEKQAHELRMQERERFIQLLKREAMGPRVVSLEEDAAFDQSLHGVGFRLWRALRGHHPEIDSVQAALNLIERAGSSRLSEIQQAMDVAAERDILKNSEALGAAAGNPVASPGDAFTAHSPAATDGPLTKSAG